MILALEDETVLLILAVMLGRGRGSGRSTIVAQGTNLRGTSISATWRGCGLAIGRGNNASRSSFDAGRGRG